MSTSVMKKRNSQNKNNKFQKKKKIVNNIELGIMKSPLYNYKIDKNLN